MLGQTPDEFCDLPGFASRTCSPGDRVGCIWTGDQMCFLMSVQNLECADPQYLLIIGAPDVSTDAGCIEPFERGSFSLLFLTIL